MSRKVPDPSPPQNTTTHETAPAVTARATGAPMRSSPTARAPLDGRSSTFTAGRTANSFGPSSGGTGTDLLRGLLGIVAFFYWKNENYLSAGNFTNLMTQMAGVTTSIS